MSGALQLSPAETMTVTEFLAWEPNTPHIGRWQLVDGVPIATAPASLTHGMIQSELCWLIRSHLGQRGSPCRVATEPGIIPRLRPGTNWRVPDLGVTCEPAARDGAEMTAPVLLIEILSPGNQSQTRANVWTYTTIPSVQELVLVHGTRIAVELLRRGPDGVWPAEPVPLGAADTLALDSIDLAVPVPALYATTALAS